MLPIRISQPEEMSKLSLSASDAGFANFIDILFLKKKKTNRTIFSNKLYCNDPHYFQNLLFPVSIIHKHISLKTCFQEKHEAGGKGLRRFSMLFGNRSSSKVS